MTWSPEDSARFAAAIDAFDKANSNDPSTEEAEGRAWPTELLYARRLTEWVLRLNPDAPEALRLAARCQHICRWEIPRGTYPPTKPGYLKWREDLKKFHAQRARGILQRVGYEEGIIERVSFLNLKKGLPFDPDTATLEDALCLVFLEHQFRQLIEKSTEQKMVEVVRKTWQKMSAKGRETALQLSLSDSERHIIRKALSSEVE